MVPKIADPKVKAAFDSYTPALRRRLMALRAMMFETAAKTPGVGTLEEALRWGQPSYLTSGSGSTIRIDALKGGKGYAAYFHCQSGLVPEFKRLYGDRLRFEGKRAILFGPDEASSDEVAHCIALALTHHARKAKRRAG